MDIIKERAALKDKQKGRDYTTNALVRFIYEDEKKSYNASHVCHFHLRDAHRGCALLLNSLQDGSGYGEGRLLTPEEEWAYIDWLINRSPYESVFSDKDAVKALADNMLECRTDVPNNLLAAALVASRRLWEYPVVVRVQQDLISEGLHADLAYLFAHSASTTMDRKLINWGNGDRGHCSLRPDFMGPVEVKNFIQHKLAHPGKLYKDDVYYASYDTMYGKKAYADISLTKRVHSQFNYKQDALKDSGLNPFVKSIPNKNKDNTIDYWLGIKRLAAMNDNILAIVGIDKGEQRAAA